MEKVTQRHLYLSHFNKFCQKVKFNDKFIDGLNRNRYFKDYMKTILEFPDDFSRKVFILLEFTRLRSTCEEIIEILKSSGQEEAANELKQYNISLGPMQVSTEVSLKVYEAKAEMIGSLYYSMIKKPRGKCIIINNVPKEVHMESQRFKSIFEQLFFEVELLNGLTSGQMRDKLTDISKDTSLQKHEAFIVMVISHGEDEKILGYNACQEEDLSDLIEIKEIVDIFSEINCRALINLPKLFFFTCCRNRSGNKNQLQAAEESVKEVRSLRINVKHEELEKLKFIDQQWTNENKDTFISYSCSEGYKTFYNPFLGITHFGQALSHSIAQYACEENLQSIMSRTCDFMANYVELSDRSAPELRGHCMRRQLYLNPGHHK